MEISQAREFGDVRYRFESFLTTTRSTKGHGRFEYRALEILSTLQGGRMRSEPRNAHAKLSPDFGIDVKGGSIVAAVAA